MSETESTENIVEEIDKTEERLADAVEAVAYKKGDVKDDVKDAVAEKKDAIVGQVKEKVAGTGHDAVETVKDKVTEAKEGVVSKVAEAKEAAASKLPGGEGHKDAERGGEGLGSKVSEAKDAVVSRLGDLKDAVADKLPGGAKGDASTSDEPEGQASSTEDEAPATDRVVDGSGAHGMAADQRDRPVDDEETTGEMAQELREEAEALRAEGQPILARAAEVEADETEETP